MPIPNYASFNPYMMPQPQQYQQPLNGYIKVKGIEGANSYNMPPNSSAPLFDIDKDVFYAVSTDANGKKTVVPVPYTYPKDYDGSDGIYATKEDLTQLQNGMNSLNNKFDMIWEALNGKQSVSSAQQSTPATN